MTTRPHSAGTSLTRHQGLSRLAGVTTGAVVASVLGAAGVVVALPGSGHHASAAKRSSGSSSSSSTSSSGSSGSSGRSNAPVSSSGPAAATSGGS